MKKLAWLLGLAALALFAAGCGGTCGTFCDYSLACIERELDGCEFDDPDELNSDCNDECNQAVDKLTRDERDEFSACVSCVADQLGSPDECSDGDYADAIDDCDSECNDSGVGEFFDEFDFEIRQSDLDC